MPRPIKAIFLDIDGVLNSTYGDKINLEKYHDMEIVKIKILRKFMSDYHFDGVIITSMRRIHKEEYLFIKDGLQHFHIRVLGKTPFNYALDSKKDEILYCLNQNKHIYDYLIFDDTDDQLSSTFKDKFIKINPYWGLIEKSIKK